MSRTAACWGDWKLGSSRPWENVCRGHLSGWDGISKLIPPNVLCGSPVSYMLVHKMFHAVLWIFEEWKLRNIEIIPPGGDNFCTFFLVVTDLFPLINKCNWSTNGFLCHDSWPFINSCVVSTQKKSHCRDLAKILLFSGMHYDIPVFHLHWNSTCFL